VLKDGFIDRHVPTIRALYKAQCHAMLAALDKHLAGTGIQWNKPYGGMFLWVKLPQGMNAADMLPKAVERNVAYVPGAAFYSGDAQHNTLRLSFVTASVGQINEGIAALADVLKAHLPS
jgi:2-aminoadipate transaminase